jgi:predicted metal-dependent peptidase
MELETQIVKTRVKMLKNSPFFGTLLLHTQWREEEGISTAATDGQVLLLNREFMESLSAAHFQSVLLHEMLHMALSHVERMKDKFEIDPQTSNIAADIVVNGIIQDNGLSLPSEAVTDNDLKHLSVREIYSILKQKQEEDPDYLKNKYGYSDANECLKPGKKESGGASSSTNWNDVINKAKTISSMKKAGARGAGIRRIFKELLEPRVNWRDALYRYITAAKTDFEGFDRRFVSNGLYLDDLGGGKINIVAFIDTSASVDEELLGEFVKELRFAVNALPQISGKLYYFDTKLYYQGEIEEINDVPQVQGGGGTSFKPIMAKLDKLVEEDSTSSVLGLILTDGFASMHLDEPNCSMMWCISPGGINDEEVPFGEVIRIEK